MQNHFRLQRQQRSKSSHFKVRYLISGAIVMLAISSSFTGQQTTLGPTSAVHDQGARDAGTVVWREWIPLAGTIGAALIAGLFALRQQRRAAAAQRDLETQKLEAARREAEISEERAAAARFRQTQVLPFLDKLDESLTKSFAVVQIPEFFPELGAHVPQIRLHTDETVGEWTAAMEQMSEHRMQLLLAMDPERIPGVISLLTRLVDLAREILGVRNRFWYKHATITELRAIQHDYVRIGYRLMMEIKEAVMAPYHLGAHLSDLEKEKMAQELAIPFEKGGVVAVPYGSVSDFSWVAIWQVDTRTEWQKFEQTFTRSTVEEFEEAARKLAHRLYQTKEVIDMQLSRIVRSDDLLVLCLSAKLPSMERLHVFKEVDLPSYRCEFKILWSSHRAPIEFTTGLKARDATTTRGKGIVDQAGERIPANTQSEPISLEHDKQ